MQEPAKRFTNRMKKLLFLTSFEFRTGETQYKESRLVMVQDNEILENQDAELVAYLKLGRWFPKNYPESTLISCIAHPTITGYAEENVIRNKKNEAFKPVHGYQSSDSIYIIERMNLMCEQSLNPERFGEWEVIKELLYSVRGELTGGAGHIDHKNTNVYDASWNSYLNHPNESEPGSGYSDDVSIDIDGNRKDFIVGWYDFDDKEWKTGDDKEIELTMKWQYLPLAKYDKL